jgi:tryptophan 2,3-dioxygenase
MSEEELPSCTHIFKDPNTAHYCSYIQVPGLLSRFYRGAETVDEIMLCSGLYAYALWWNLQENDLKALLHYADTGIPISPEQSFEAIKRANRLVETDRIMLQQGIILRSELLRHVPHLTFRFASANTSQLEAFHQVAWHTRQLEQKLGGLRLEPGAGEVLNDRLLNSLKDLILTHRDSFSTIQRDFTDLLWAVHEQPAPRIVSFEEVVPEQPLFSYSKATMQKHHPQTLSRFLSSNDELTFITAHQTFEVWFPTVIRSIQEATSLLRMRPARIWEAEGLARRIADLFYLFGRMIHIPQTMTAADYIEFRDQLKAGSGVESYQFRAIEISAGLRDEKYSHLINKMQLMTDTLRLLWDTPSLNDAVMEVLVDRGIISLEDDKAAIAHKLGSVLRPSGAPNENVDIMALAEALVRFEQNVELWRVNHIAMVTRMIGRKTGTGADTYGSFAEGDEYPTDSLPYLRNTLQYQKIFPALWDARDYLQGTG